ncbi:RdgB/HAM1 family non-canonical purine NTP pyrophosphatase [bacterium]|nr:RdgB/HAM1 family non-canonical purine NTP pyrophosphatase [bacterium]
MSSTRLIVLGSTNRGKLRELQTILADQPVALRSLDGYPDAVQPEEDGATFVENARKKALGLAQQLGLWVLADDSGLCVDALDGRPGVHSARYAGPDADDAGRAAHLLGELSEVADAQRGAEFRCVLALASRDGVLLETEGTCRGRITRHPRGECGFGFDPVFLYPEYGATFAEISAEAKNAVSHRGQAVRAFAERLPRLLAAMRTRGPE